MSDQDIESNGKSSSYYSVLEIHKDASTVEIHCAYRKLALKWHPDRCTRNPTVAGEPKRHFQQIQEAYSVGELPRITQGNEEHEQARICFSFEKEKQKILERSFDVQRGDKVS